MLGFGIDPEFGIQQHGIEQCTTGILPFQRNTRGGNIEKDWLFLPFEIKR